MSKHSPGPWKWESDGFDGEVYGELVTSGGEGVLFPCCTNDSETTWCSVSPGNARLIAAAPRLLEALKVLIAVGDRTDWNNAKALVREVEDPDATE